MRPPRGSPVGPDRTRLPRRRLSSPGQQSDSRKRPQVRPKNWNQRPYLLHGCVLPKMWLRLRKWKIAPLVLLQRSARRIRLSLRNLKPRLRLLLKHSRPHLPPSRRRKQRLPLKRSRPRLRLCPQKENRRLLRNLRSPRPSRKWKLRRLLLLAPSLLKLRLPLSRCPKQSHRHSQRSPKPRRLPRQCRHPFSTSF
jgi:hypothetical protein